MYRERTAETSREPVVNTTVWGNQAPVGGMMRPPVMSHMPLMWGRWKIWLFEKKKKKCFPPKLELFMESNHAQGGRLTHQGSVCSHGAGEERVMVKTVFISQWQRGWEQESICAGGETGEEREAREEDKTFKINLQFLIEKPLKNSEIFFVTTIFNNFNNVIKRINV